MGLVVGMLGFLFIFFTLLLVFAIPLGILWLLVVIARGSSRSRYDPAAEALRVRFARGEITQQQFEEGMRALGYEKVR